jgi:uroporphyrinogen-III synthase
MAYDGVLVTRPEPGATETAARLAALGWRPILAPALVLAPRALAPTTPRVQALLLTSRAAARALTRPDPCPPVFAVGEATAEAARQRGFAPVFAAPGGNAAALAALVGDQLDPVAGPLLLAVGAGYARDLEARLRAGGFRVLRRVVYAARPALDLPEPARVALAAGQVGAALFLSPRSAGCAISLLHATELCRVVSGIEALCISARVARAAETAAAPHRWRALRVAEQPDQEAVLRLLGPRRIPAGPATPAGERDDEPGQRPAHPAR